MTEFDPIRAEDVKAEQPDFLWGDRVPKGMISVIAGRPDQGKGLLAVHITAAVTSAGGKVIHSAAEDDHGLMTRPRLEAAGANLKNVILWNFSLPNNFDQLAEMIRKENVDLVVMDPFASHLARGVNRHGDGARPILQTLKTMIKPTKTAVVIVEHALKRVPQSGHPLQAIGGTALPQFARAAFVYGQDPDDEDLRVLAPAKFNIGPWPKAISFEVDTAEVKTRSGQLAEFPFLMYDDELASFDPMSLFLSKKQPGARTVGRPADKRQAAAEWLTNYLAAAGKPVHAGKIAEDAKQYGMASKTLKRAAQDMGVVKAPPGGGRNTTWDLPDDVKDLMDIPKTPDGTAPVPAEPIGPRLPDGSFYLIEAADRPDLDEGTIIGDLDISGMDDELADLLGGGSDE